MVRVQIEVESGTGRFRVPARATTIVQAVRFVSAGYPGASVRVVFPIELDAFFAGDVEGEPEIVRAKGMVSAA